MTEYNSNSNQQMPESASPEEGMTTWSKIAIGSAIGIIALVGATIAVHEVVDKINAETQYQIDHPIRG